MHLQRCVCAWAHWKSPLSLAEGTPVTSSCPARLLDLALIYGKMGRKAFFIGQNPEIFHKKRL